MITIIRNKTGLSQSQLALYLGISKAMVNLVERGQRELKAEASNKLTFLYMQLLQNEQDRSEAKMSEERPSQKWINKQLENHSNKIKDFEYKVAVIDRKISKINTRYQKSSTCLNLSNYVGKNAAKQGNDSIDELWFELILHTATLEKAATGIEAQQSMQIEKKLFLGYIDVHKKILEELKNQF